MINEKWLSFDNVQEAIETVAMPTVKKEVVKAEYASIIMKNKSKGSKRGRIKKMKNGL